jgi:hypothetical protein
MSQTQIGSLTKTFIFNKKATFATMPADGEQTNQEHIQHKKGVRGGKVKKARLKEKKERHNPKVMVFKSLSFFFNDLSFYHFLMFKLCFRLSLFRVV